MDTHKTPEEYLKEPYTRVVIPDRESGTFTAQILEFPGCIAQAENIEEAYQQLEKTALSWLEAALDSGHEIPSPLTVSDFGGKVALRLPKSLHKQAVIAAELDGISLNQFIVTAVAERAGAYNLYNHLMEKLENRFSINGLEYKPKQVGVLKEKGE